MIKKIIVVLVGILILALLGIGMVVSRYDFNRFKQPLADAVRQATGRQLTVGGDIDLSLGLRPALQVQDIGLANFARGSRPEMVRLKRLEVQVSLLPLIRGNIEIERFILIAPDILIESDAKGRSNMDFSLASAEKASPDPRPPAVPDAIALPALALKALEIRDGRITYRDGAGGQDFQILLKRVQAGMTDLNSPLDFSMTGDFKGEAFRLEGRLGPLAAAWNPAVAWPVALKAGAADITMELDGQIQDLLAGRGLDLNFYLKAPGLARTAALAGVPLPGDTPVELRGNLKDAGGKAYRISGIDLRLGTSDLAGTVGVDLSAEKPRITADLASKRIDAVAWIPPAAKAESRPEGGAAPSLPAASPSSTTAPGAARVFPDNPLPLKILSAIDATVTLQLDRIQLPDLAVEKLVTALVLVDSRLVVSPFTARVGDGAIDGTLTLATRDKTADLAARWNIKGFDAGQMLKALALTDTVEGRVDADLDVKSRGTSVADLMAGLNGHFRLVMENGRIGKGMADLMGGNMLAELLGLIRPTAQKKAKTDINCCVVRLDALSGLADVTVLFFDTPQLVVAGEGAIDLGDERLDISLKPTPKEGLAAGKFGKITMSLSELSRPFKLSGTLSKPALHVDAKQTAMTLGKTLGAVGLFGPVGIASALVGGSGPGETQDLCPAALEAARTGRKMGNKVVKTPAPTQAPRDTAKTPAKASPLDQVGAALKGLLGN